MSSTLDRELHFLWLLRLQGVASVPQYTLTGSSVATQHCFSPSVHVNWQQRGKKRCFSPSVHVNWQQRATQRCFSPSVHVNWQQRVTQRCFSPSVHVNWQQHGDTALLQPLSTR